VSERGKSKDSKRRVFPHWLMGRKRHVGKEGKRRVTGLSGEGLQGKREEKRRGTAVTKKGIPPENGERSMAIGLRNQNREVYPWKGWTKPLLRRGEKVHGLGGESRGRLLTG